MRWERKHTYLIIACVSHLIQIWRYVFEWEWKEELIQSCKHKQMKHDCNELFYPPGIVGNLQLDPSIFSNSTKLLHLLCLLVQPITGRCPVLNRVLRVENNRKGGPLGRGIKYAGQSKADEWTYENG